MRGPKPTIERVGPGPSARFQILALRCAAAALGILRRRGLGAVVSFVGQLGNKRNHVVFRLPNGARLKVDTSDPYWMVPLLRDGSYEPEVGEVLERITQPDSVFVDCGANVGYWSAWMAATIGRPGRVVAIEAAKTVFDQLLDNARLNDDAFGCLHAVVWSRAGDDISVAVDPARHSWSSAAPEVRAELEELGFDQEMVPAVTIDKVLSERLPGDHPSVIVKIDVEGAEIEALRGANRALSLNTLVIYEDHGRAAGSEISRFVIEDLGLAVFHCDSEGRIAPVDLAAIRSLKVHGASGYNFFACRNGSFIHTEMTGQSEDPAGR